MPARPDQPAYKHGRLISGTTADSADTCGASVGSVFGHGYCFEGAHWSLDSLPINFRLNETGFPASMRTDLEGAARAATLEWDSAATAYGNGPRRKQCLATTRIMCLSETTFTGGVTDDGINTISFAHLGEAGPLALANRWLSGNVITDVDIQLNLDVDWFWVESDFGVGTATGVPAGALGGVCSTAIICADKWDLQGVLAHEFGHAIGLEDIGSTQAWPSALSDAPDYTLVMYRYMYPNSSLKRVLGWGDLLGLERDMFYTETGQ